MNYHLLSSLRRFSPCCLRGAKEHGRFGCYGLESRPAWWRFLLPTSTHITRMLYRCGAASTDHFVSSSRPTRANGKRERSITALSSTEHNSCGRLCAFVRLLTTGLIRESASCCASASEIRDASESWA